MPTPKTILVFDTETTGKIPQESYLVSLAFIKVALPSFDHIMTFSCLILPENWTIPEEASRIHGISHSFAVDHGLPAKQVIESFNKQVAKADEVWAHNAPYDVEIIKHTAATVGALPYQAVTKTRDSMIPLTDIVKIPSHYKRNQYKWPTLTEAYNHFYQKPFENAHTALGDVIALLAVLKAWNPWHLESLATTQESLSTEQTTTSPQTGTSSSLGDGSRTQ